MALPLLLAVTVGLVWLLSVGVAQVRVVDAAREAARAIARGEDTTTSVSLASRAAPAAALVQVSTGAETVVVTVSAGVDGPGGLFAFLPSVQVRSMATARLEPDS